MFKVFQASTSGVQVPTGRTLKKERILALILILICTLFVIFVFHSFQKKMNVHLQVIHCSVGQGDAILLKKGSFEVLIDAGPGEAVLDCLDTSGVAEGDPLEVVVATHGDADHIGGMRFVLERYVVGVFLWNGWGKDTAVFRDTVALLEKKSIPRLEVKAGDSFSFETVVFRVLWPDCQHPLLKDCRNLGQQDANAGSVVLQAKFGDFSALFFGDLPGEIENSLAQAGVLGKSVWLKVSHHGSATSSFAEMLETVRPQWCSMGVGKNRYGHPKPEVIQRLESVGCQVLRTDLSGTIRAETDGRRMWLRSP